jgi:oxygen-independent coproporphyrinogen-3 oxidase
LSAFGVYVHVPFCRERCDYCAFAPYTDRDHLMERYADACILDVERAIGAGDLVGATSVFFGGGTPSRLHPDTLCRILDAIARPAQRSPSSAIPRTPTPRTSTPTVAPV